VAGEGAPAEFDAAGAAEFGEPFFFGEWGRQVEATLAIGVGALTVGERRRETDAAFETMFGQLFEGGVGRRQFPTAFEAIARGALAVREQARQGDAAIGAVFDAWLAGESGTREVGPATAAVVAGPLSVALELRKEGIAFEAMLGWIFDF
jgi:hypothetical protein